MAERDSITDDAEELDALERLIRRADGFALAFARVNSPARRRELADDLRQRLGDDVRIVDVVVPPEATDLQAILAEAFAEAGGDGKVALFVTGIERVLSSVRERTGFLPVLNYKRENLQRSVPCPVVLWMPEFALRHIARGAPDLWAWRSGVFEFTTDPEETEQTWKEVERGGSVDEYAQMTFAERVARIETLEALYQDYSEHRSDDVVARDVVQADIAGRLGRLYRETMDLDGALEWTDRAIAKSETSFGLDHPSRFSFVSNHGHLLMVRGDFDGAERAFQRALEGFERTLGPDHPATLASVGNTGTVLKARGDLIGTERICRRVLKGYERALGPDHPITLKAVNNLGDILEARGDTVGAERMHWRALSGREAVLGRDHPDTLWSVSNLAYLLQTRGDLVGAERMVRRALEGNERTLGADHPSTLASANILGTLLLEARGDLEGAERMIRRVLKDRERVLGPRHPDTLKSHHDLGYVLLTRGDLEAAKRAMQRAVEGAERVFGPGHPTTEIYRRNLGVVLGGQDGESPPKRS